MNPVHGRQTGVALVVTLWMITLLTIMAASFSLSTQRSTGLVRYAQDRARGLALADAGVHYALIMLSIADATRRWRSDGTEYQAVLPGGTVSLTIFDESGKIDLNAASEQTLRAMLGRVMGNDDMAAALTDKIMDWRDVDDLKRLNGAEAKDYLSEGKSYVPQNKNFQAVEELQMVLGITPALYKTLEPLLTIHTGQDGFNPQKSSGEALRLLLGMDPKTVSDFLSLRRTTPANAPAPLPIPLPQGLRVASSADVAYTIFAESRTEEGSGAGLKVIAKRQFSRKNGAPFTFVSWRQQIFGSRQKFDAVSPPLQ